MNEARCSICLKPCEIGGTHRQVFINCGHYFGEMCIREELDLAPSCPRCKKYASEEDIRIRHDGEPIEILHNRLDIMECPVCGELCKEYYAFRRDGEAIEIEHDVWLTRCGTRDDVFKDVAAHMRLRHTQMDSNVKSLRKRFE